jgi:hypothetical protein
MVRRGASSLGRVVSAVTISTREVPADGGAGDRGGRALEPEVPLCEALASYPYIALAVDEIRPQFQLEEDVEAELVEEANRLDVAADRANLNRLRTALTSLCDDSRREQPAGPWGMPFYIRSLPDPVLHSRLRPSRARSGFRTRADCFHDRRRPRGTTEAPPAPHSATSTAGTTT